MESVSEKKSVQNMKRDRINLLGCEDLLKQFNSDTVRVMLYFDSRKQSLNEFRIGGGLR
jgi:hypothetical protein